ncbi:tyrosine-type recombinase/integrase [Mycoplasmopsis caviae]|uniref:Tyrosine recombinase XerC n=1 Tax=Mycoplasmopsis caviae TaxID=55603 RepID=A0A3P8K9N9_9BACT|nr:tyrosine-type recombinase/integrase [Mycoplasmopsis caviae]UUD35065.1 tyrosine-type recombinase/integrase [Mycoplasmopsis caviae]VDR42109.1 Tyrosine recombinase XerC [Mycoplasmopsis caviae]
MKQVLLALSKDTKLSKNTILSYTYGIKQFKRMYGSVSVKNLQLYKLWLIENYKSQTVNLRIRSINYYLEASGMKDLKLSVVKVQQKPFLENIISEADYEYLKNRLLKDNKKWYFVIRFMAATGCRVSELTQLKIEHIKIGYLDLLSKGSKLRRIYIPKCLQEDTLEWAKQINLESGFLFTNKSNKPITTRGIAAQLRTFAIKYNLDINAVYPHSFRHRFAKNFLAKCNDIAFLADLMGHESIETTRIYLRKSAAEQREIVDSIIDW